MSIIYAGAMQMKKGLVTLGIILGLIICSNNFAYSADSQTNIADMDKIKTVTEIGSLVNQKQYNIALEKCNSALEIYKDEADLYYWRATILASIGQHKEALVDYDKVVSLKPQDSTALVMRGICKSELQDTEGAIADFNQALHINPQDPSAYSMRACVKLEMGDYTGANEDLDKANKLFEEVEKHQSVPVSTEI